MELTRIKRHLIRSSIISFVVLLVTVLVLSKMSPLFLESSYSQGTKNYLTALSDNNAKYGSSKTKPKKISATRTRKDSIKFGGIYGEGCPPNLHRPILGYLLWNWTYLADRFNIKYFLCGGSLLGAVRDGEIIPYDRDVDLCMSDKEFFKLKPIASRKPFRYLDRQIHLVLLDDYAKDPDDRRRVDCKGRQVLYMRDPCSFITPWARFLHRRYYLDIFVFQESGEYLNDVEYKTLHFTKDVFPLKSCTFMGIPTKCPRNSTSLLLRYYEPDFATRSHYICRNHTWVPTSKDVVQKFQIRYGR